MVFFEIFLASSIQDSRDESLPYRLSGYLSCPPLSSVSSGSSGVILWLSHIPPANSLAIWITSGSEMFSLILPLEVPKSPICYLPFTNACSLPSREYLYFQKTGNETPTTQPPTKKRFSSFFWKRKADNRQHNRPALAIGAAADRGRMLPCLVFIFVWSTIIYDPIACWTWNSAGWVYKLGGLDFAGGTPVHISSGAAALAYSLMLGKRRGYSDIHGLPYRPHNVTHVVIGTVFLWVGWFGFNGGSALGANLRAVSACVVTHFAASVGGFTWVLMDYRIDRKWSTVGFCSGCIAGLVAITPASGFVPVWSSVIFGVVGAAACNMATKLKYVLRVDDSLDIFAVHAIGGIVGNLLTGLFAA